MSELGGSQVPDALPPGVLPHFPSRAECVVAAMLERHAAERPDDEFAIFPDETWTFAEAASRAWAFAAGLIREGVVPGESVAVWCPTRPEMLQAWLGINTAGAVYAPLTLASRGAFLQHALNLAAPRVLVAHGELIERLRGLDVPSLELVVSVGPRPDVEIGVKLIDFSALVDPGCTARPGLKPPVEPWDDCALIFTSGTTGPSKGVRASYASQRLWADSVIWPEIGADDRFLVSVPLSHVAGISLVYGMLQRGGAVVLPGGFNATSFWAEVHGYRATATLVMHAMVTYLLGQPPRDDDADNPLRFAYMGPLTRVEEFCTRFGLDVWTGFGMTEVPVVLRSGLNPTGDTTVGRPFNPDFECRLVDEHDLPVPDGTPGELIVRHRLPWVVNLGYKDMPEATAQAWRNGWFHTGDQLMVDARGDWVFVDRAKDAIRRRGENISSYEVEAELLAHPDVDQVAAIAVPNPDVEESTRDEEVKVVVVPVAGSLVDPRTLAEFLVPRMPHHMVPRFIEVVDELPRTPSFKVKKAELRKAGITAGTWDREKAGRTLRRETLG